MTTHFVTRHPGARDWARRRGLPVNLVAEIQQRGCDYIHLSLQLPAGLRGKELDADQLDACRARLQACRVEPRPLPEDLE